MGLFFLILVVSLIVLGGLMLWSEHRDRKRFDPYDDTIDVTGNKLSLLPGDIKYKSPTGNFQFYFPLTTSIVLSIVLTVVLKLFD